MKRLLFVIFTYTAIFNANATILPSELINDVRAVRNITGFQLHEFEYDKSYYHTGLVTYMFDKGLVKFHAYTKFSYPYSDRKNFADALEVTQRFFAATKGKEHEILGLNVEVKSTRTIYDLIVSRRNGGAWSVLVKSLVSELPQKVKKFCKDAFKVEPTFR